MKFDAVHIILVLAFLAGFAFVEVPVLETAHDAAHIFTAAMLLMSGVALLFKTSPGDLADAVKAGEQAAGGPTLAKTAGGGK